MWQQALRNQTKVSASAGLGESVTVVDGPFDFNGTVEEINEEKAVKVKSL